MANEYRVVLSYEGFCSTCDKAFFKAAKSVIGGSGYSRGSGCGFGERDHDWSVKDQTMANDLAKALKNAKMPCGPLKRKVQVIAPK